MCSSDLWLQDLGGLNGSSINNVHAPAFVGVRLCNDDILEFGATNFRVVFVQAADHLAAFGITLARDGAGVDDAEIRGLVFRRVLIAGAEQPLPNEFGFVLVDLATEGIGSKLGVHWANNRGVEAEKGAWNCS